MCNITKNDKIPPITPANIKRDTLITEHLPFAYRLARKYRGLGLELDDLRQLAAIGLIRAADAYDPDAGAAFTTLAAYTIKAEILRGVENQGRLIRVPSHMLAKIRRFRRFSADYLRENGREPSDDEAAEALGMTAGELSVMQRASLSVLSLDQPTGDDDGEALTLADTLVADEDVCADVTDADEGRRLREDMTRALDRLPEDERTVLRAMFFENRSRGQVARLLRSSDEAVTVIRTRALRHLREPWARRLLLQYRADILSGYAYRSSFTAWEATGCSSTEMAALKLSELDDLMALTNQESTQHNRCML